MITLCRSQFRAELDLQIKYHPLLWATLEQLLLARQDQHRRTLEDIHNKEVGDLKKKLDTQNKEEMRNLAKRHKDRNELARYATNFQAPSVGNRLLITVCSSVRPQY